MTLAYVGRGTVIGKQESIPAYITASASDATTTVNGLTIDNRDGQINFIAATLFTTSSGGTSPTANLQIQGSNDGTNFAVLNNNSGSAIQSGATSIGSNTNISVDTQGSLRRAFPPYIRVSYVLGGTSPTVNGTVSLNVSRNTQVLGA